MSHILTLRVTIEPVANQKPKFHDVENIVYVTYVYVRKISQRTQFLFDLFENLLLIHLQTVRHLAFDPVRTSEGAPRAEFRTSLNHVIIKSSKSRF